MSTVVVWVLITSQLTFGPMFASHADCDAALSAIRYQGTCKELRVVINK